MAKEVKKEFAVVEFDDSCDESQTLIEVIPSKWLLDDNTKCKYPPKKDKLKATRLVMSKMDPGQEWDIYKLQLHHYYSTYNTALKAAKAVIEGETARTEVETDYDEPRKRKKNKKYESSSENEDMDNHQNNRKKYRKIVICSDDEVDLSNVPSGASSDVPPPDSFLPNKLRTLFKSKSVKTSAVCQQKDTSIGKLLSRNEARVTSKNSLKSTHKTTLDENSIQQDSLLNEDCSTQMSEKFTTPLQSKTQPFKNVHRILQHVDKENYFDPVDTIDGSSNTLSMHVQRDFLKKKRNVSPKDINKAKLDLTLYEHKNNNGCSAKCSNIMHSETPTDRNEVGLAEEERILTFMDNENETTPNSSVFQGLSNADRDLLTTTLSHLKTLHGPAVSNLDRDLLRDVSSKLDMVLMNQRRILNEIFPNEAILQRPENCPPLPLRDEDSFKAFNDFLKDVTAYSQFVNYLTAHIENSDQWNATTCLMSIIFHNQLARQISWKGTGGSKISFYATKIKDALFCAIMNRFQNQSLKNTEEAIKRWLNTSGQRK